MGKFAVDDIKELYASEAARHGIEGTSTIQDMRTRELELDAIASYIEDDQVVLEVGCGNGYLAARLAEWFNITYLGIDLSEELIAQARSRPNISKFMVLDVLDMNIREYFDLVFSVRCLQNLVSWEDQQKALTNIVKALMIGGEYVMEEGFWTGLDNLNDAREELGLGSIPESWHNNFFQEEQTIEFMKSIGCEYVDQNAFLSGYYFGSRVLLPALLPKDRKVSSASRLNDYFAHLPPAGDFCPMKILWFRRMR